MKKISCKFFDISRPESTANGHRELRFYCHVDVFRFLLDPTFIEYQNTTKYILTLRLYYQLADETVLWQ